MSNTPAGAVTFGSLFERAPFQFGRRGDSHMWWRLREEFAQAPLPDDRWALRRLIEAAFLRVVGQELPMHPEYGDWVGVEAFAQGNGMTDGEVAPYFWRYTALPLIYDRWAAATGHVD